MLCLAVANLRAFSTQRHKHMCIYEPRSKLLAWRRDIDLGVIVFLVSPIVLQIKPNVRIRLSGLGLLHGWEILEVLGSSTTLVLEMPRLGSWLDCAWL